MNRSDRLLRLSALGGLLSVSLGACMTLRGNTAGPPAHPSASAMSSASAPPIPAEPLDEPVGSEEVALEDDEAVTEEGRAYGDWVGSLMPHPLDGWTPERIAEVVRTNPSELGSLSVGAPNAGALFNGIRAEASNLYEPVSPDGAFGTEETLRYLAAAIQRVHAQFPNTPPLWLGHISASKGGHLSPHVSHQAGRDVDIGFYYVNGAPWYQRGTRRNLDLPRTWAFVRALITETDVEMILIDHSIQALLREHALQIGEDREWVEMVFKGTPKLLPIIRHVKGHATHIHIRFFNPIAQEAARRCYSALVEAEKIKPPQSFIRYRAKPGDTLIKIAKKFGVSVATLKTVNGLKNTKIRASFEYRIPVRGVAAVQTAQPLRFPTRRLPPAAPSGSPVQRAVASGTNNRG